MSAGDNGRVSGAPLPIPRYEHGSRVPPWRDAAELPRAPEQVPDPALTEVPEALRTEVEELMSRYPDAKSASIPALAAAQRLHGWVSPQALTQVACVMGLTPAYLVAVASFYDMLDMSPQGTRRVYVCTNISCSLRGGRELLQQLQDATAGAEDVQVRGFECLGACDIAPMASVDGVYVGPVAADEIATLAEQITTGADPLPAKQLSRRPTTDPGATAGAPPTHPASPRGDEA